MDGIMCTKECSFQQTWGIKCIHPASSDRESSLPYIMYEQPRGGLQHYCIRTRDIMLLFRTRQAHRMLIFTTRIVGKGAVCKFAVNLG